MYTIYYIHTHTYIHIYIYIYTFIYIYVYTIITLQSLGWSVPMNGQLFARVIGHNGQVLSYLSDLPDIISRIGCTTFKPSFPIYISLG